MALVGTDALGNEVYSWSNIDWTRTTSTWGQVVNQSLTGTGLYVRSTSPPYTQFLSLDLLVDGTPLSFVSDTAPATATFPAIDITATDTYLEWLRLHLNPVPRPSTSYCSSLPHSGGLPALIGHSGSASIASNDLVLQAQPVPVSQPGLFLYGTTETQLPFGNGWRCVGSPFFLLAPTSSGTQGTLTKALDVTSPSMASQFTAGTVWKFQAWFRDPAGGGSGYNTSDGLTVTFQP